MMPFSSSLSKYASDTHDLEISDGCSPSANNLESRSSPLSSFEIISRSSVDNFSDHPLLSEREAIKIKAQCLIDGSIDAKTMTIDPNITSFASLYLLLKKAFSLNNDFDISYLLQKSVGNSTRPDIYLSLTSDWDLDAAFHTASYPQLVLKVTPVPKGDVADWDVLEAVDAPLIQDIKSNTHQLPFSLSIKHEVSKKIIKVLDALVDMNKKSPLSDKDWADCFDGNGRVISANGVRIKVFHHGLTNSLRREAWVHLLGVYPSDLTSKERIRFLFMKTQVYKHLKENWLARNPQEIESVSHMVQKDVLRTDRNHPYFNVPEDHPNIVSLFNILLTYALNNTDISYCQGMSDLAAPLLVVTQDETLAYLCFCKVMQRLRNNFLLKGAALLGKFTQLSLLLRRVDYELFHYFQDVEVGNMYFCYRMLLLELKREFPFSEALAVMETIWCSIPPDPDDEESEVSFYYGLLQSVRVPPNGRISPNPDGGGIYNQHSQNAKYFSEDGQQHVDPLPHPKFLNDGSPFPLFLCLAILLENRDTIMGNKMDYAMVAIYFDKLSRRHDASKIIVRAKTLFFQYLRSFLDGQTIDPTNQSSAHERKNKSDQSSAAQC